MTALQRTTEPSAEPVTLSEAKAHLRVSLSDDDTLIANLISVARMACEDYTRRALITQGWTLWLDEFPQENLGWWDGVREGAPLTVKRFIHLPRPPLQAVVSVAAYDDSDNGSVFSADYYFVDSKSEPGRLALRNNASWPKAVRSHHGIGIVFTAGYGNAAVVPQALKQGMLAHLAQMYEDRGDRLNILAQAAQVKLLPDVARALYQPYRIQHVVLP